MRRMIPGGGGAVGSLVHHPGAALTASAGPVDATYAVDFQLADVMCRTMWKKCADYMRWPSRSVPSSATSIRTSARAASSAAAWAARSTRHVEIDFDGGGIKIGVDGERPLQAWLGRLRQADLPPR